MAGGFAGEKALMDRKEILNRFESWLDSAIAGEAPPAGIPDEIVTGNSETRETDPTDFYSMWASVVALTQEVKLQGRAFKQLTESLSREIEQRTRKQVIDALLDLRERLFRSLESVPEENNLQPSWWDKLFSSRMQRLRHSLEVLEAMREGYRLGLARLDELLGEFQIYPIECEGSLFDPRRMNAVDIEQTNNYEDGTVVSVYRAGYEWNGEVYRPAQVRVARNPRGELNHE
jgi:GrpE